jgi:hypothetical protein
MSWVRWPNGEKPTCQRPSLFLSSGCRFRQSGHLTLPNSPHWLAVNHEHGAWTGINRTEIVFEMLVFSLFNHLTQLIAWENFNILSHWESYRSYNLYMAPSTALHHQYAYCHSISTVYYLSMGTHNVLLQLSIPDFTTFIQNSLCIQCHHYQSSYNFPIIPLHTPSQNVTCGMEYCLIVTFQFSMSCCSNLTIW